MPTLSSASLIMLEPLEFAVSIWRVFQLVARDPTNLRLPCEPGLRSRWLSVR